MVCGKFILLLPLLLSVSLLKQTDGVNETCTELQDERVGLEADIRKIRELQHKYEQCYGQCKVIIYICKYINIYIYIYIKTCRLERRKLKITDLKYKTEILVCEYYESGYNIVHLSSL